MTLDAMDILRHIPGGNAKGRALAAGRGGSFRRAMTNTANSAGATPTACLPALALSAALSFACAGHAVDFPTVAAGRPLEFPRDHGSHPDFRTEWWYVTGWLATRPGHHSVSRSPSSGRGPTSTKTTRVHSRRISCSSPMRRQRSDARTPVAGSAHPPRRAGTRARRGGDTEVWIDDWRLERRGWGLQARMAADGFRSDPDSRRTRPPC